MTAAFLYWGGYREMMTLARLRFSGLNLNGIYVGLVSLFPYENGMQLTEGLL